MFGMSKFFKNGCKNPVDYDFRQHPPNRELLIIDFVAAYWVNKNAVEYQVTTVLTFQNFIYNRIKTLE